MRFFFDRCVPKRLARMVDVFEIEHEIVPLDDDGRFEPTTADVEWLGTLADDDPPWIVVSGDGRILRNKVELSALKESGLTFFSLAKAWTQMDLRKEYAWKFLRVRPNIVARADVTKQRIFEVAGGASLKIASRDS